MSENAIIQQLEVARSEYNRLTSQLSSLERQRDIAKAKLEAFELSAKYLADMQTSTQKTQRKQTRKRMPSSNWIKIFSELYSRYSTGFGYDQIMGVASAIDGVDLKRPSLRTKMMNLVDSKYVERINDGEFRITPNGATYFGLVTEKQEDMARMAPPPPPSPQNQTPSTLPQMPGVSKVTDEVGASSNDDDEIPW